jgi:hypothetical protein
MPICCFLSLNLSTFYLLVTHTRWEQREKDETSAVTREREKEISLEKRAVETGNTEEERCMLPERLVYSCRRRRRQPVFVRF